MTTPQERLKHHVSGAIERGEASAIVEKRAYYMRQAITTKYLPVTNRKPSRVKATAEAGTITLEWDHAYNTDGNHIRAAKALAEKFKWKGLYFGGALPRSNNASYAFVMACNIDADANEIHAAFRCHGLGAS